METITIPRTVAKQCMEVFVELLMDETIQPMLGPQMAHKCQECATKINDILGRAAIEDLMARRVIVEDDPE